MDTLKTGFVVVLLLAVLYGVYVVLNKDATPPTAEIAWHQQEAAKDLQIEIDSSTAVPASSPILPANAPDTKSASDLNIPSVIKAELSPSEDAAPAFPSTSLPAELKSAKDVGSTTVPASAVPTLQPINAAPEANSISTVSAPSLLSSNTAEPAKPAAVDPVTPVKPRAFNLPSLREPAATTKGTETPISTEATVDLSNTTPVTEANPGTNGSSESSIVTKDSTATVPTTTLPTTTEPTEPAEHDSGVKPISTIAAFEAAMREASANIAEEEWYQALFLLSKFHESPDLPSQQQQELIDLLDPLAAKVIYSQDHLLTEAHDVQRGETLEQIALENRVPPQLLANINGIENTDLIVPGTKLKIVRGPFRASVDLTSQQLTLYAGQLYAGRFPISIGKEPAPQPGEYRVMEKLPGKDYQSDSGQRIAADDPTNPYGHFWISLGKDLAIHSSPERGNSTEAGCISLSPLDAQDVFSILSEGSTVTIR